MCTSIHLRKPTNIHKMKKIQKKANDWDCEICDLCSRKPMKKLCHWRVWQILAVTLTYLGRKTLSWRLASIRLLCGHISGKRMKSWVNVYCWHEYSHVKDSNALEPKKWKNFLWVKLRGMAKNFLQVWKLGMSDLQLKLVFAKTINHGFRLMFTA